MKKHNYPISRVVYVRNLPRDTLQSEVVLTFEQFGEVTNVLLLIEKSHAFVEFKNLDSAIYCLQKSDINLGKKELQISTANRSKIEEDRIEKSQKPTCILLISITNVIFPVTADVLQSVFNKFGEVLRVIIFQKLQGE